MDSLTSTTQFLVHYVHLNENLILLHDFSKLLLINKIYFVSARTQIIDYHELHEIARRTIESTPKHHNVFRHFYF